MDSGMIGKIQKAKRYAEQERDRFHIESFVISVDGTNNAHKVTFKDSKIQCTCDFFQSREYCSHTMALEEIMKGMEPLN